MNIKLKEIILVCLSMLVLPVSAQKFAYDVSFHHFLDNREYTSNYEISQTMLGARLNAMAGATLDTTQGFMAGVNYLYEYGDRINGNTPTVDLFYYYQNPKFSFIVGSFPRRGLLHYPLALLTDTLDNYRPNIQGAYLETRGDWGYENFWIDWTSRIRSNVRETFLAGLSGELKYRLFFFDHYFYMYHRALYGSYVPGDAIRDNGAYGMLAGVNLAPLTNWNTLSFRLGSLGSYNRQRPATDIDFHFGFFTQLHAYYRKFGIDASYYKGQSINAAYGDHMYLSGNYARIDFGYLPINNRFITTRVAVCLHDVDKKWQNSETFTLIFHVGERFKSYHNWPTP
ncbi:MAG: hypothetical protein ACP5F6_08980 [Microbacter sp.]